MARTTKRGRTRVPPVINKLLKTVSDLPAEDAIKELQTAWENEPSMDKRQTLMKARIKLLEDIQKSAKSAPTFTKMTRKKSASAKKEAEKVVEAEVIEVAPEPEEIEEAKEAKEGTVTSVDLDDLGALFGAADAVSDDDTIEATATEADDEGATPPSDAIAMPPPAAAAEVAAPEEPPAPAKPQYTPKKIERPAYADDEEYQQIWAEMAQEGLDKLTAVRMSEDDYATRLEQAKKDADWLGFGAERMGEEDWANTAHALAFDCDHMEHEWELDQGLNDAITKLSDLKGQPAPDLPAVDVPADAAPAVAPAATPTAVEPPAKNSASAPQPVKADPVDPNADMSAIFAEMGDGEAEDKPQETAAEAAAPEAPKPKPRKKKKRKKSTLKPSPFADDEMYMEIWDELVVDTMQALQIVRHTPAPFEKRLKEADHHADKLCYAAVQMGFAPWVDAVEEFTFNSPALPDTAALNEDLDQLLEDLQALRGDKPPIEAPAELLEAAKAAAGAEVQEAAEAPSAEPEPEPAPEKAPEKVEAKAAELGDMNALFAEMGDSDHSNDEDVLEFDDATPDESAGDEDTAEETVSNETEKTESDVTPEQQAPVAAAEDTPAQEATTPQTDLPEGDMSISEALKLAVEEVVPEIKVDFDPTPIKHISEDTRYGEIWEEMVVETLQQFALTEKWQADFDARVKRADDSAARLLHAAQRMGFDDWVHVLEDFAFDIPVHSDDKALSAGLKQVRTDLQALRGDEPEVAVPENDTYVPPKREAQTGKAGNAGEGTDASPLKKAPKALVTDTNESAQKRSDWESEDFWSWDEEDTGNPADTPAASGSPAEVSSPAPAQAASTRTNPAETPATANALNQDADTRGIWKDMVAETLEGLKLNQNNATPLSDRLARSTAQVQRLHHAAQQMGYDQWVEALTTFENATQDGPDQTVFDAALASLLEELNLLKSGAEAVAKLMTQDPMTGSAKAPSAAAAAQAAEAAKSRQGKATLDDLYKFFPKG
jgi:hypothetical protein